MYSSFTTSGFEATPLCLFSVYLSHTQFGTAPNAAGLVSFFYERGLTPAKSPIWLGYIILTYNSTPRSQPSQNARRVSIDASSDEGPNLRLD